MVDSGSDVVTARQEILNRLDLELIGTIQSRGVHTTVEKQLYKAMLVIGNHEVEIEVMQTRSNYQLPTHIFSADKVTLFKQFRMNISYKYTTNIFRFLLENYLV